MSGTSRKWRYIPIDAVFNKLPREPAASDIIVSISRINWVWHHLLHRKSHYKQSPWKVFKEHHELPKNLAIGVLTEETIDSSEMFICRICNVQRTDSVDAARHTLLKVLQDSKARSNAPNKWCVPVPFDESTLSSDDMEKCIFRIDFKKSKIKPKMIRNYCIMHEICTKITSHQYFECLLLIFICIKISDVIILNMI